MYKLLLCLRYLRTRYIALASIISMMLGVATMIVVNSVMAGFSSEMRDRIHGILADVVVETNSLDGVPDAEQQMATIDKVAGEYIEAMTATVEVYGMMSFQYAGEWITRPITLIGIDPASKAKVGPLVEYLDSYNPVLEDGQVVRKALRATDTPPGWELTDDAMAWRTRWKERQQWINSRRNHDLLQEGETPATIGPDVPDFADEPEFSASTGSAAADAPDTGASDRGTSDTGTPAVVDSSMSQGTDAGDDSGSSTAEVASGIDVENPFSELPTEQSGGAADEEFDNTAPLKARLYVGHGLISFMREDRETGKNVVEMMVQPGDDVLISTVSAGKSPDPRRFAATVVDTLKTGMSEYDSQLVLCNLEFLQEARGMIDPLTKVRSITSIQIKLKDYDDSREVVQRLRSAFPPGVFSVRTWEQKQGPLLAAVEVESAILNVLLFLIIAVAGFGILAIFFMIVVEKMRDIGILKALGASSAGVMKIFLSYGLALGIVGSGVGVILGLLFVRYINVIEAWITWVTGRKVFDEKIYYFPEIPTAVHPMMVFWVAVGAMTIAVLASVLPARRAARLHPVESLRYQ